MKTTLTFLFLLTLITIPVAVNAEDLPCNPNNPDECGLVPRPRDVSKLADEAPCNPDIPDHCGLVPRPR